MIRRSLLVAVGLATTLVASRARATETAALRYERATEASACPDETALRRSVTERLGYEPFTTDSRRTITVHVRRGPHGHEGVVGVVERGKPARAERLITSEGACSDLIQALALSISVILDPMSILRSGPSEAEAKREPPSGSPPVDEHVVESSATPEPTSPPAPAPLLAAITGPLDERSNAPPRGRGWSPLQLSAGGGVALSQGDAPALVPGALLYAALRRGMLGGTIEGHVTASGSAPTELGTVSSWSATALGGPCVHVSILFGCALGGAALVTATADVALLRDAVGVVPLVGPRIGLVFRYGDRLELRFQADALASLRRHRLAINDQDVYEYAPGRLAAAALAGVRF